MASPRGRPAPRASRATGAACGASAAARSCASHERLRRSGSRKPRETPGGPCGRCAPGPPRRARARWCVCAARAKNARACSSPASAWRRSGALRAAAARSRAVRHELLELHAGAFRQRAEPVLQLGQRLEHHVLVARAGKQLADAGQAVDLATDRCARPAPDARVAAGPAGASGSGAHRGWRWRCPCCRTSAPLRHVDLLQAYAAHAVRHRLLQLEAVGHLPPTPAGDQKPDRRSRLAAPPTVAGDLSQSAHRALAKSTIACQACRTRRGGRSVNPSIIARALHVA